MRAPRLLLAISISSIGLLLAFSVAARMLHVPTRRRAITTAMGKPAVARGADSAVDPPLNIAYGKLPISFEANAGQMDSRVKFMAQGHGYRVFLTSDEVIVSPQGQPITKADTGSPRRRREEAEGRAAPKTAVHIRLLGANTAEVAGVERLPGVSNYYIGNDPGKWRTNVPTYGQVRYTGIYPGIDLLYYGKGEQLEHDFVVAPGADPNAIVMRLDSEGRVAQSAAGDLELETDLGQVTLVKPTVYQVIHHERRAVKAHYVLASNNEVHFAIDHYDRTESLIIDPVLKYSSFLGGWSYDAGVAIAVDSAGEAYVVGTTSSPNFPMKNPIDTNPKHFIFITKVNSAGSGLVYSTFFGADSTAGAYPTYPIGIALDGGGAAYVSGSTGADNFPVKDAYQSSFGGGSDGFITKLSSSGSLVYSTYLGGPGYDSISGVAADSSGKVYVTGWAEPGFPTTRNSFNPNVPSPLGIFVARLNAAGKALDYSGVLVGDWDGSPGSIAIDSSGSAYVAGHTYSIPVLNAFQPESGGGLDGFVTKISPAGDRLIFSTYLGGPADDYCCAIAVSDAGHVYLGGTVSKVGSKTTFPVTWNALQKTYAGGNSDGFFVKLSSSGQLRYSTLLGGKNDEYVLAIAVDQYGTVYIAGDTASPDFPLYDSLRAVDPNQVPQGFLTTLAPSGELGKSIHYYSTTIGASLPSEMNRNGVAVFGVAVDSALNAYITGVTAYSTFPTTRGAFQPVYGKSNDAFVSKVVIAADLGLANSSSPTAAEHSGNLTYTLTTQNNGPDWAAYLKLDDPLPAGTTFVSYNAGGGICTAPAVGSGGTLSCTLPRLNKGELWDVQLVVKVNATAGSNIVNTAHIKSNMQDLVWQNNYATLTTAAR